MANDTWTPGDQLYSERGCHVRRMIEMLPQPSDMGVFDAARWPEPYTQHDLDTLVPPGAGMVRATGRAS